MALQTHPLQHPTIPSENLNLPGVEISIKHPGYSDRQSTLFNLPGFDNNGTTVGVHFGTIKTICSILTRSDDGFFTNVVDGPAIDLAFDAVLGQGDYYYNIPNDPQYAIYPSFDEWPFPHETLPEPYSHAGPRALSHTGSAITPVSLVSAMVVARDKRCLVSRDEDILQKAHLCPKDKQAWFRRNAMLAYNSNAFISPDAATEDTANAVAMRQDIHTAFDKPFFVIVKKEGVWNAHFLKPTVRMGALYHNMPVELHPNVSTQFLYARLAWAIFPFVRPFLQSGFKRNVLVQVEQPDGEVAWRDQQMSAKDINTKFFRSRSQSPPKNRRIDDSPEDAEVACLNYKRRRSSGPASNELADTDIDFHCNKRSNVANVKHEIDSNCNFASMPSPPVMPPSPSANAAKIEKDLRLHEHNENWSICSSPALATLDEENLSTQEDLELVLSYMDSQEAQNIYSLKMRELLKRRPSFDGETFCCNYERYEKELRELACGRIDPEEASEHMCIECAGMGEPLPMQRGDFLNGQDGFEVGVELFEERELGHREDVVVEY